MKFYFSKEQDLLHKKKGYLFYEMEFEHFGTFQAFWPSFHVVKPEFTLNLKYLNKVNPHTNEPWFLVPASHTNLILPSSKKTLIKLQFTTFYAAFLAQQFSEILCF